MNEILMPAGAVHRIENLSPTVPLVISDGQTGPCCEEDGITRYSDDYGRGI